MSSTLDNFTQKIQKINIVNYEGSESDKDFRTKVEEINRLIKIYRSRDNSVFTLECAFIRHVAQILSEYSRLLSIIQRHYNAHIISVRIGDKDINIIDYTNFPHDDNKKYVQRIVKVL